METLQNSHIDIQLFFFLQRLPLQEGTSTLELWRKPPATPILSVYFFNVTNADEFLKSNGTIKLVLQEFGPYTYR